VTLTGHTNFVNACAISPDCSFIVSASEDGTLKILPSLEPIVALDNFSTKIKLPLQLSVHR
jgi:WD40 repeat protein